VVCDKLGLHLLLNSGDMSFHFKFQEVIFGKADTYLDDGNGQIDVRKFVQWWNMDLDELFDKDKVPEEPETHVA
jgi:hypothetical protein